MRGVRVNAHQYESDSLKRSGRPSLAHTREFESIVHQIQAVLTATCSQRDPTQCPVMDRLYDSQLQSLFEAVIANDIEYVTKCFVEKQLHVDARDGDFNTPLLLAAYFGHIEIALLLLKLGARVNETNQLGITPVMAACTSGSVQLLHQLVKHGGDLRVSDLGNSPLGFACAAGHLEIVQYLVSIGHDFNIEYKSICPSYVMLAAMNGHDMIMMYFFLPSFKHAGRLSLLPADARENVLQVLESADHKVPIIDIDETVPMFFDINLLTLAVVTHNRGMFELLLELGADLNFRLKSGNTVADVARNYDFNVDDMAGTLYFVVSSSSTDASSVMTSSLPLSENNADGKSKAKKRKSIGKPELSLKRMKGFISALLRPNK
uniref:ANK_REP_REGION domain-containing protein n=1 Tax=Panagrellus redivivus TaxID=6233 RepID=A0A7E4VJI3_PANRE